MEKRLSPEMEARHDDLYEEASRILRGAIILDGSPRRSPPGWFARRKLRRAASCLEEVLRINPDNWQAMFMMAKVCQRFADWETTLMWFQRALALAPEQAKPSLAKEAGWAAGELGRYDLAIRILRPAVLSRPEDGALHVNLGVSLLLAGRAREATAAFLRASDCEPGNTVNKRLAALAREVAAGRRPCPKNQADIARAV